MNDSELIEFLRGIEKSVGELSKRIEKLEYGLKFLELNDRLDKIESMCFSENTLSNRADELRETLFSHILCIYLYRNTTNNFHHWCMEVNAKICGILNSRLKKGGRHPSREQALNAVLDSTFLLEDGLPMMLSKILTKEGSIPKEMYRGKETVLRDFVVDTLKKIFALETIDGENIEEVLDEFNTRDAN